MKIINVILIIILAVIALGIGAFVKQQNILKRSSVGDQGPQDVWYCPMHPWIKSDKPGVCPICGMALVPGHEHNQQPAQLASGVPGYVPLEISRQRQQLAGVRTALVTKKSVIKTIRATGQYEGEVYAQVFEDDLGLIKVGQKATVEFPAYHQKYEGSVISIDPSVDESSRTTRVRIWLQHPNRKQLKLNMFADVQMPVNLGEAIVVPRDAVMDTGLRKIVFIERGNDQFEPREIQTGWETDDGYEVRSGLKAGERIAVSGNFLLDSESRVQAGLEEGK